MKIILLFYAIWINAKFLQALNKTLKFDLKKDDHDSLRPSRQIAAQFFLRKHYQLNKFWLASGTGNPG